MTRNALAVAASLCVALSGAARADTITLLSAPPGLPEGALVDSPVITAIDGVALPAAVPAVVTHTELWGNPFVGASFVSSCPTCGSQISMCQRDPRFPPGPTTITFVHRFELPAAFATPALQVTTSNDDAANVFLNGHLVGRVVSFNMPGAPGAWTGTVVATEASWFRSGTNELRYELENYNAPCPLSAAYFATVDFTPAVVVSVEVKPGSSNTVNLGSRGVLPVAVLSSAAFDARTIDPLSVTLAQAAVALRGQGRPMVSFQDVNGDGLVDLVVDVETEALRLASGDTTAELRGRTFSGQEVLGQVTIRVVP